MAQDAAAEFNSRIAACTPDNTAVGRPKIFSKKTLVKNFTMMQLRPRFAGGWTQSASEPAISQLVSMSNALD
jgi:hypothetical protein